MSRFKTMLMAMVAVFAIGAVGASAASAASGNGTITMVGSGSCDVTFDTNGWSGSGTSWSTTVSNIQAASGGTCDVGGVSGNGTLTKNSDGTFTFAATSITVEIISDFIECTYEGSASGTWYWTLHNDTAKAGTGVTGSSPPGEDKYFQGTGSAVLSSGGFLCPGSADLEAELRTHEVV